MNYLNNGGSLYIESVNIGYDYENTEFFEYLGLMFLHDGTEDEVNTLKGGCYNCTEDMTFPYLGGISAHHSVDRLEADGGELLFSSEDGYGRMFVFEEDDYKVISSSAMMAAMANADSLNLKPYLVAEFVDYFIEYNPVTTLKENISEMVSGTSYPNPFRHETNIAYTVKEPGKVSIDVYNHQGQLIKQFVEKELQSGEYIVTWDATNNSGIKVKDGVYYYRIVTPGQTFSGRMILQ